MYPDLFEVPLGEATEYPFLRYADECKLCRELQSIINRPPLAMGTACEEGLEYLPCTPPLPGADDPGFSSRPTLAERRFRVRHGVLSTANK